MGSLTLTWLLTVLFIAGGIWLCVEGVLGWYRIVRLAWALWRFDKQDNDA